MSLQECLQASWFQKPRFNELRSITEELTKSLMSYADFLASKTKYQRIHHAMSNSSNGENSLNSVYLNSIQTIPHSLKILDLCLKEKPVYDPVFVREFAPEDQRQRYKYLQDLKNGLTSPTVLVTFTTGGNVGNYNFINFGEFQITLTCKLLYLRMKE